MKGPAAASGRDLRALARIVTDDRGDPPAEGLPPSLLSDLAQLAGCDFLVFGGTDSRRMTDWFGQTVPAEADDPAYDVSSFWAHYWDSPCSHPERTGDLRSLVKISDFYTARQWHSTGMYQDCCRPYGIEHELMLCLPDAPGWTAGPGRSLRLVFIRGPGPDFSGRHHDLLTVLRPHLHQAYLQAERRRHPVPRLTARQQELLRLVAAGHTNAQIARRLGISDGTVRTHLENIYRLLQVSSRTAAITRVFADRQRTE
ncbi:DNA-binding response regulator [Trebonia kvetii]|uniref:DNA-binding response regulator n=1 Tax=Trebonia kvetii TaxID=2480626 RepID=A0A6P2BUT2_9ACTN|nr:response regulator transcription factor [Trebonia kvetii]TVZ01996.1 DNA-binding response regulator [Trebonia kvetii]